MASGKQTGLTGPNINNVYFQIAETGVTWLLGRDHMPGTAAIGAWYQNGLIQGFAHSENDAAGLYLFGSQRLWYKHPDIDVSGISMFYQYGVNNSRALSVKQYIGAGLTAFGLVANRLDDSMGLGIAFSWLNQNTFPRSTELMYQAYYQAKVINGLYLEPALSYIPAPGQNPHHSDFAGTIRIIAVF